MRCTMALMFGWVLGCGPQLATSEADNKVTIAQSSTVTDTGAVAEVKDSGRVVLPPGAIAGGSTLVMEQVATPEAFGVGTLVQPAASAVQIAAYGSDGSELTQAALPMTISLALPPAENASLNLLPASSDDNLCVLLLAKDSSLVVWRRDGLTLDTQARTLGLQSPYFGVYQIVYCGRDQLPGFKEAALIGLTNEAKLEAVLAVPVGFRAATKHGKYCAYITRLGTARDDVIAVAEADAGSSQPIRLPLQFLSSLVDDVSYYVLALGLMPAGAPCFLNVGDDGRLPLGHDALLELYARKVIGSALRKRSVDGTLGEGIYALKETTLTIGAPEGVKIATPRSHTSVCVETASDDGYVQLRTSIDDEGKFAGDDSLTIPVMTAAAMQGGLSAFFGSACGGRTVDAANPRTGIPYLVRWPEQTWSKGFLMAPFVFQINNALKQVYQGDACVKFSSADKAVDLGQRLVSLSILEYGMYLPFWPDARYALILNLVTARACSAVNTSVSGLSFEVAPNEGVVAMEINWP